MAQRGTGSVPTWHPNPLCPPRPRNTPEGCPLTATTDPRSSAQERNEGPHNRTRCWRQETNLHRFHLDTPRLWDAPKPHAVQVGSLLPPKCRCSTNDYKLIPLCAEQRQQGAGACRDRSSAAQSSAAQSSAAQSSAAQSRAEQSSAEQRSTEQRRAAQRSAAQHRAEQRRAAVLRTPSKPPFSSRIYK